MVQLFYPGAGKARYRHAASFRLWRLSLGARGGPDDDSHSGGRIAMETVLALVIGALYAAGLFMMLRPSAVRLIIGISLLGHAANLLIFTIAGLTRARPPLITGGLTTASA